MFGGAVVTCTVVCGVVGTSAVGCVCVGMAVARECVVGRVADAISPSSSPSIGVGSTIVGMAVAEVAVFIGVVACVRVAVVLPVWVCCTCLLCVGATVVGMGVDVVAVACGRVAMAFTSSVCCLLCVVGAIVTVFFVAVVDSTIVGMVVDAVVVGGVERVAVTFTTTPPCCMIRCCSNVYLRCVNCFLFTGAAFFASCASMGVNSSAVAGDVMSS